MTLDDYVANKIHPFTIEFFDKICPTIGARIYLECYLEWQDGGSKND